MLGADRARPARPSVTTHALAFGLDHIILDREQSTDAGLSKYLSNTAALRGKPSLAVEAGRAGTTEPADIAAFVNGSLNVLRYLKALPGPAPEIESPVWRERAVPVLSEQAGLFYPLVQRGTFVAAGMKLGYVTDFFGKTIFEAHASAAGVVLYICSVHSLQSSATSANVGAVAKAPP